MKEAQPEELKKMVEGSSIIVVVDEELAEKITPNTTNLGIAGAAVKNDEKVTWLKKGEVYLVETGKPEEFYLHEKAARQIKKKWQNELPKTQL